MISNSFGKHIQTWHFKNHFVGHCGVHGSVWLFIYEELLGNQVAPRNCPLLFQPLIWPFHSSLSDECQTLVLKYKTALPTDYNCICILFFDTFWLSVLLCHCSWLAYFQQHSLILCVSQNNPSVFEGDSVTEYKSERFTHTVSDATYCNCNVSFRF